MWFGILGPLLVHDGEMLVDVPKGRQRVLLADLLVHAGEPVPADALAEVMWDGGPPSGAAVTLRSHVLRLRRALGPQAGARLVTRYPGYLLQAGEEEVNLLRFRCLCREAGATVRADDWAQAHGLLGRALGLWRGTPLADIPCELLHRDEVLRLEQLRLQALEWRIEAGLHLGRHAELVSELQSLAAQNPLRERFHTQLMLALYRCGRQAEALAAYQCAREVLVEELGTEPGADLRELHQRMLAGDPALAVSGPAPPVAGAAVPRELPAQVAHFTGRTSELAALSTLLDAPGDQMPGTVVISAIGETAGMGKTTFAVHAAHRLADRFPAGQIFLPMHGHTPGQQPVDPADALASLLLTAGVSVGQIPPGVEVRMALWRDRLAER